MPRPRKYPRELIDRGIRLVFESGWRGGRRLSGTRVDKDPTLGILHGDDCYTAMTGTFRYAHGSGWNAVRSRLPVPL